MAAYTLGSHEFESRLIIGSGKYESFEQNLECAVESGAEMVTVALRRTKFDGPPGQKLLDVVSPERFTILPNTAGCFTAEDAISTARMGRELLGTDLVKLEVIGDDKTLFPDVAATLGAAKTLVDEGFTVLPYVTDDPVACQRLEPHSAVRRRDAAGGADRLGPGHPQSGQPAHHPGDAWRCP